MLLTQLAPLGKKAATKHYTSGAARRKRKICKKIDSHYFSRGTSAAAWQHVTTSVKRVAITPKLFLVRNLALHRWIKNSFLLQHCSSRLDHQQFKWSDDAARFRGTPWPLVTWLKFSTIFSVQETIRFPIRDRSPYRFRTRYSLHNLRHCSGQCKHVHLFCCVISKLARGNTATNVDS